MSHDLKAVYIKCMHIINALGVPGEDGAQDTLSSLACAWACIEYMFSGTTLSDDDGAKGRALDKIKEAIQEESNLAKSRN